MRMDEKIHNIGVTIAIVTAIVFGVFFISDCRKHSNEIYLKAKEIQLEQEL